MRILIVTQYFWPENFRVNDLAQELVARGHRVTVLTGMPNYPSGRLFPGYGWLRPARQTHDGVEIVRIPLVPRGNAGAVRLALNYVSFAVLAAVLGPWRVRGAVDAIFVHEPSPVTVGIPAIAMKRARGAPILFWVLDLWPESVVATGAVRFQPALAMLGALTRWIYRRCDIVLAQSRGFVSSLTRQGVAEDKLRYFPSWAEPLYVPLSREAPPAPGSPDFPEGFRVMFAGNIGAAQDFPTILAAAEQLRDEPIHWLIVGDGRMARWVRDQVEARGLGARVHLYGQHPQQAMPAFFARADALLVSLRREPIFALTIPAKIQSYLACGRPIVAALDGEGARIVEESGAGIACPAEDPSALAAAVRTLAGLPPDDLARMGRRALDYSRENFSRDALITRLEGWLAESADAAGHRR